MELRHLRYFIAVAEEGHITRAAERLGMQQPPLSQQIKALERELDVQLFHRKARGVELTDAGHAFLDEARATLAHLEHACETTRRTARGEQGRITVGYTSGASLHPLVSYAIRTFRDAFPLVSVTLAEGYSPGLIERVRNDQIDIAFIQTAIAGSEGIVVDLLQEEITVVALPSGHALARSKNGRDTALSLKALAGETFIAFGNPHGAPTMQGSALVAACQAAGFSPRISYTVSNNVSRLNLVAVGLGISAVAASVQRINIEGVVFRRLKGSPPLKTPLNLVSRRGEGSAAVRQFLKLVKQATRYFRVHARKGQ